MNISSNSVLLELHVPDFKKAKEFYGKMGFKVVWERKPEEMKGYLVMKLDDNILCFWSGNETIYDHPYFKRFAKDTKRGFGVEIVIMVKNIEKFYKKVRAFANVVEELVEQPWGLKDFRIEDPFGFYLRFNEPHNILDKSNAIE